MCNFGIRTDIKKLEMLWKRNNYGEEVSKR